MSGSGLFAVSRRILALEKDKMKRDEERFERNRQILMEEGLDALICSLPINVLLLSGYWSVMGTSLAIFTKDGKLTLLVPEDELHLAEKGWADEIKTFAAGSLNELRSISEVIKKPLKKVTGKLGIRKGSRIGIEDAALSEPATYAAMNIFGTSFRDLVEEAAVGAELADASNLLTQLCSVLTKTEIGRVKTACAIAARAFESGAETIGAGLSETEVAAEFRHDLSVLGKNFNSVNRAGGFTFCMSGENSYEAFAAFQRSRRRRLSSGDLALVHCNSYADGFWTDISRTFCLGEPSKQQQKMYEAVFAARDESVKAIHPGVRASEVDRAARDVLTQKGFGKKFKHGLGHGVGFHAIDHNAQPRLHPVSPDVLETGMVFNVEPAIYIEDFGGIRQCEMVAVTENGAEILTPFQSHIEQMVII